MAEEDRDERMEHLVVKTRQILERAHLARLSKDGPHGRLFKPRPKRPPLIWKNASSSRQLTIAQRSLICSDIKELPETDEVEELLFKIQDLLVPFLPEDYPDENAS